MKLIEKRVVLHFTGFEPLDGVAHRARYERSARQSAAVWGYSLDTGAPETGSDPLSFAVKTGERAAEAAPATADKPTLVAAEKAAPVATDKAAAGEGIGSPAGRRRAGSTWSIMICW